MSVMILYHTLYVSYCGVSVASVTREADRLRSELGR